RRRVCICLSGRCRRETCSMGGKESVSCFAGALFFVNENYLVFLILTLKIFRETFNRTSGEEQEQEQEQQAGAGAGAGAAGRSRSSRQEQKSLVIYRLPFL